MIKIYNTLSKTKEEFKPYNEGILKIYSCGPTVYSTQHIGNMRAVIFTDTLKRVFKYFGYKIEDVLNITDVGHLVSDEDDGEDKILKASKKENKDPFEIAKYYEKIYLQDLEKLNINMPKYLPRASEHIIEQINIIKELEKKGYTYIIDDGVYFDTSKFKEYGQLSKQSQETKKSGARIEIDSQKKNSADFALWKFLTRENKNHILKWESPWGTGFPGWHIECSAMGHKYLGSYIDIHTGGIEHIPIHHENEIAQNICSNTIKDIKYWMHNEHLLINNEKMSKSLGNVYVLSDLENKGYNPISFRETCLRTHYRKQMNFTFESLDAAQKNVKKINDFYKELTLINTTQNKKSLIENLSQESIKKFENAIADDLNTPLALSYVFDFISEFNKLKEEVNKNDVNIAKKFMEKTDSVLGLLKDDDEIPLEVLELAKDRKVARDNKEFKKSDEIREEIKELGYEVKDSNTAKKGFILTKI
ncbi:MAG: cysteine--tRNA ligase [Nanoarchaeota archaeon]